MIVFAGRPAIVVTAGRQRQYRARIGVQAERAALTTVLAEVGVALNRSGELRLGLHLVAREAIVAHLTSPTKIWVIDSFDVRAALEMACAARAIATTTPATGWRPPSA